jgi:hypothetical protein
MVPEERKQKDDRQRNSEKPQQQASSKAHGVASLIRERMVVPNRGSILGSSFSSRKQDQQDDDRNRDTEQP